MTLTRLLRATVAAEVVSVNLFLLRKFAQGEFPAACLDGLSAIKIL